MKLIRDAFEERCAILEDVLPHLFKDGAIPDESLIRAISVHQALARAPGNIVNVKRIKVDTASIFERFGPSLEIVSEGAAGPATCPITRGVISKPWRGACGHVFEESAVLAFKARKSECPVLGCGKPLVARRGGTKQIQADEG